MVHRLTCRLHRDHYGCNMNNTIKYTLDATAVANVVATIVGLLPAIAAGLSIIWLGIQIYDRFKKKK